MSNADDWNDWNDPSKCFALMCSWWRANRAGEHGSGKWELCHLINWMSNCDEDFDVSREGIRRWINEDPTVPEEWREPLTAALVRGRLGVSNDI